LLKFFLERGNSHKKDWELYHTGGGIWCLQKEMTTVDGEKVMVRAFEEGAAIEDEETCNLDLEPMSEGGKLVPRQDFHKFSQIKLIRLLKHAK
jgi:hypothetical protein